MSGMKSFLKQEVVDNQSQRIGRFNQTFGSQITHLQKPIHIY